MLGLVTRLFRGIKFQISNIHIRYEDDYFQAAKPYSFGFAIQSIQMDTDLAEE